MPSIRGSVPLAWGGSPLLLAILAAGATGGCGAPTPAPAAQIAQAPGAPVPTTAAPSASVAPAPGPVDAIKPDEFVDTPVPAKEPPEEGEPAAATKEPCKTSRRGYLQAYQHGVLVFRDGPLPGKRAVAPDITEDQRAIVPASVDHAWSKAPVLLTSFDHRLASVAQAPSGNAFAVRMDPLASNAGGDELGLIDTRSLAWKTLHRAKGRLRMLGVVGERAIALMLENSQGGRPARAFVVGISEKGDAITSPELPAPLRMPADEFDPLASVSSTPHASAIGRGVFAILCGDEVCLARVSADAIALERVPVRAQGVHASWSGAIVALAPASGPRPVECLRVTATSSSWASLPRSACPEEFPLADQAWLPIDGVPRAGVPAELGGCLARTSLELPATGKPRGGSPDPATGVFIEHVGKGERRAKNGSTPIDFDVTVRGRFLDVGLVRTGGTQAGAVVPDLVLSIPERGATISRGGLAGTHKVRVRLDQPLATGSGCWQGRVLFRARNDTTERNSTLASWFWEIGKCE